MSSVKSGTWTDPTVWSCNRLPNSGDVITISASHTVTIPANTLAKAYSLKQEGTLVYASPSATLQLGFIPVAGLIAYYPFNGNANDESGNGRNATMFSSPTFSSDRFGNPNKALDFDGVNDRTNAPALFTTQMSVTGWFKGPYPNHQNGSWPVLVNFGKEYYTIQSFGALEETYADLHGKIAVSTSESDGNVRTRIVTNQVLMDSTWHHFAAVYDASQRIHRLYIDSKFIGETPVATPYPVFSSVDFGVSDSPWGNYTHEGYFKGQLDDIRIYNRALTADEVQTLYHQQ